MVKQKLKTFLFGTEPVPSRILFGVGRGIMLKMDLANNLQRKLGLAEWEIASYFSSFAPRVADYIEVGASDGYYCLLVNSVNPDISVYAFEPQDKYKLIFEENLRINNIENTQRFTWNTGLVGCAYNQLGTVLKTSRKPFLLKIDVDGAEMDVLRSGRMELLERYGAIILETHSAKLEEECTKFLQQAHYETRIVKKASWRVLLPEHRPSNHNQWLIAERWI